MKWCRVIFRTIQAIFIFLTFSVPSPQSCIPVILSTIYTVFHLFSKQLISFPFYGILFLLFNYGTIPNACQKIWEAINNICVYEYDKQWLVTTDWDIHNTV
jgi:hypothetical protein